MASAQGQPKNLNYFIPTGFNFQISKIPHVNYFCQSVNLPGISTGQATINTPFRDIPIAGDKAQFNELRIRFIVDEELQNWLEIYDWIVGLTFPNSFSEYKKLEEENSFSPFGGKYSDGTIFILTSHKNVQYKVNFQNLFPTSLSDIDMDASLPDIDAIVADVSFMYTTYSIERTIGSR